jgi:hypothetical protein
MSKRSREEGTNDGNNNADIAQAYSTKHQRRKNRKENKESRKLRQSLSENVSNDNQLAPTPGAPGASPVTSLQTAYDADAEITNVETANRILNLSQRQWEEAEVDVTAARSDVTAARSDVTAARSDLTASRTALRQWEKDNPNIIDDDC